MKIKMYKQFKFLNIYKIRTIVIIWCGFSEFTINIVLPNIIQTINGTPNEVLFFLQFDKNSLHLDIFYLYTAI